MSAGAQNSTHPAPVSLPYARLYRPLARAIEDLHLSPPARAILDYLIQRTQGADSERKAKSGVSYGIRPLARLLDRWPGEIQRGDEQLREAGIICTTENKRLAWLMHPSTWTEKVNHLALLLPSIEAPPGQVLYAPRQTWSPVDKSTARSEKRTQAEYTYTTAAKRTSKEDLSMQLIHKVDMFYFWLNKKKVSYIEFAKDMMDSLFLTWKNWKDSIVKCEIVSTLRQRICEHTRGEWTATLPECRLVLARLEATKTMIAEEMAAAARLDEAAAQQAMRDKASYAADLLRDCADEGCLSRAGATALAAYDEDHSRIAETINAAHDESSGAAMRRERADRMAALRADATPGVAPEVAAVGAVPSVEVMPEVAAVATLPPAEEVLEVAASGLPDEGALEVTTTPAGPPETAPAVAAVAAPVAAVPAGTAAVPAAGMAPAVAAAPPDPRPAPALEAPAEAPPPEIRLKTQISPSKEPDRPAIHARWTAYGRPPDPVLSQPYPPSQRDARYRTPEQNRRYANIFQGYLKEGIPIQEAINRVKSVFAQGEDGSSPSLGSGESSLGGAAS